MTAGIDTHPGLPRGQPLSAAQIRPFKWTFLHVSPFSLTPGVVLSSEHHQERPHFELFREPPNPAFLGHIRFSADRQLEAAFEQSRKLYKPTAPSRMVAVFAFICRPCAVWFSKRSREAARIYSVLPSTDATIFLTDLVWRNIAANVLLKDGWRETEFPFVVRDAMSGLQKVAEAYWTGRDPAEYQLGSRPEALIEGSVSVVQEIT